MRARRSDLLQLASRIAPFAERYAGSLFPETMAIAERESGFNPEAIPIDPKTKKPRSTAQGPFQILKGSAPTYGVSLEQRKSLDAATRGAAQVFQKYAKLIDTTFPGLSKSVRAGLIYLGHWQGGGSLQKALSTMKQRGGPATLQSAGNALKLATIRPMQDVASWREDWEQARADLGGQWGNLIAWGTSMRGPQLAAAGRRARGRGKRTDEESSGAGIFILLGAGLFLLLGSKKR